MDFLPGQQSLLSIAIYFGHLREPNRRQPDVDRYQSPDGSFSARLVTILPAYLAPTILAESALGVAGAGGTPFDVASITVFGLFVCASPCARYPLMPVLMGHVVAEPLEAHLRRATTQARGDWLGLITSTSINGAAALVLFAFVLHKINRGS